MIVFRPGETHGHNIQFRISDIRLESYIGFSKLIAIKHMDLVSEGVYLEGV